MATPLPITITASPLPADFTGTPQEFMDAIVARLQFETQSDLVLFGTGSTLPTSDQGPFLLNGTTWYVWDTVSGSYVPAEVPFFAETNPKPFRGNAAADINVPLTAVGSAITNLVFVEEFDPDGVFGASTFIAPEDGFYNLKAKTAVSVTTETIPSDVASVQLYFKKNGIKMDKEIAFGEIINALTGRTYQIDSLIELVEGDTISVAADIQMASLGDVVWTFTTNETWFSGFKVRNKVYNP